MLKNNAISVVNHERREIGSQSPYAFAQIYLKEYLKSGSSETHKKLYELMNELFCNRGRRVVVAAPRNFGKSTTFGTIMLSFAICYGKEKLIIVCSNTANQAQDKLEDIRKALMGNKKIREDFPELFDLRGRLKIASKDEIETANEIKVQAFGYQQRLRGIRYGAERPSLVLIDDLDSEHSARNIDLKNKLTDWFTGTLLKLGDEKTNYIMVGNVFHRFSVIGDITSDASNQDWERHIYRAVINFPRRDDLWITCRQIYSNLEKFNGKHGKNAARAFYDENRKDMDEESVLLWPERYDLFELMMEYYRDPATFNAELQNIPREAVCCGLDPDKFTYWDKAYKTKEELLNALGKDVYYYAACDPSIGKHSMRGDNSAIVVIAVKSKDVYVLEADIQRRSIEQLTQSIFAYCRKYPIRAFGIETNGGQEYFVNDILGKKVTLGIDANIKGICSVGDKKGRIESLSAELRSGIIQCCRSHTRLLEEFSEFPYGKHDDGIDALQMVYYRVYMENQGGNIESMIEVFKKINQPKLDTPDSVDGWLKRFMEYGRTPPR